MQNHFELIVGIIVAVVFCVMAYRAIKKAKKVDREGIETDAVVSSIKEHFDPDNLSSSYTAYVQYRDGSGGLVESPMAITSDMKYAIGDSVRIKYIPGDHALVREVKKPDA